MGATVTLRDALTAALHRSQVGSPKCPGGCYRDAKQILADPTFRIALTESIAAAHSAIEECDDLTDAEVAAAIVARMLP